MTIMSNENEYNHDPRTDLEGNHEKNGTPLKQAVLFLYHADQYHGRSQGGDPQEDEHGDPNDKKGW
eukprot:CAMPEP_0119126858 /NCGR_PEP_ID=MMETSP1310-20130426/5620_1 /TAXON_ID=464262 /ORGANISM="Genus nov. species nov., Strain RCC2339" /LENGTH=65 /DNA_ID=CAMNT_0007117051 /DNA_START=292 /DNA_END=486 /DNA_ORIENTATION=-